MKGATLVWPVGSVAGDIPVALARAVASAVDGHVLPIVPLSCLDDVLESLEHLDFGRLVVINGDPENEALVFDTLEARSFSRIAAFSWWSLVQDSFIAEHSSATPEFGSLLFDHVVANVLEILAHS